MEKEATVIAKTLILKRERGGFFRTVDYSQEIWGVSPKRSIDIKRYNPTVTKRLGVKSAADKRFQELSGKHKAGGKVLMEEVTISEKTAVQGEARKNTGLEAAEMLGLRFHLANELARYCFMDAGRSHETPGLET